MFEFTHNQNNPRLFVKSLHLKQYRNIAQVQLHFRDTLHFFVGPNAQGKTNLLESLYVTALGKSHRTRSHQELIQFGQSMAKINTTIERSGQPERLEVTISPKGKKIRKNGVEQKKLSQYIGTLPIIMFAPEDLAIVKGSPKIRRRFLDMEIGQVSSTYIYDLSTYNQLVKQRNHLLKNAPKHQVEMLEALDEQFVPLAVRIWKKRLSFLKSLNRWACEIHHQISGQREDLQLHYQSSFPVEEGLDEHEWIQSFKHAMARSRSKEIARRVTLMGPHRDDIRLKLGNLDINTFGSQGQQRTVALSLKLAEIELIFSTMGVYPIMLLDDVLSELDDLRKTQLFEAIQGRVQTFVTTTNLEGIHASILKNAMIYQVHQGTILEQR